MKINCVLISQVDHAILICMVLHVKMLHACDPLLRIEPILVSVGHDSFLQCDTSSCNGLLHSTIDKRISDNFEVAMRFNGGSVEGFALSNNVSYEVSERINGLPLVGLSLLVINRSVLEDNGHWQCRVVFMNKEHTSNSLKFEVNSNPTEVDVVIYPSDFILLGTVHSYSCASYRVYPELDVVWKKNGANLTDAGINENRPSGDMFDIINIFQDTLYKRDEYDITCFMGTGTWSKGAHANSVDIFVPTGLEKEYVSEKQPTPQDNLTMSCTVSGTSPTVAWLHDDTYVDTTMFARTDHNITDGNFSYSEPTALRSTLVWILSDESKWCEELDTYSGVFQCTGNSAKGPAVASNKTDVSVQYKPVLLHNEITLQVMELDIVELECDVHCARPSTLTYNWRSVYNKPGLEQNRPSIWINVTKDDFTDTFICEVSNDVGSSLRKFSIVETKTTPMETTAEVSSVPISTESPGKNSNLDIGAKLGIGLGVVVIVCGIIISSCVFYHRTRGYTKPKTSLHHNAYENEDITLDDTADVTPYEQVNDIGYEQHYPTSNVNVKPTSYVNAKQTSCVNVKLTSCVNAKPTNYVNAKSTSYANIDPTSYVNVNAMEPSKYEQLKQRNSGNIEICTYEDLDRKAK